MNSKKKNDSKQLDYIKLFQNDIRFQIWGLLSMYQELSFSELCKRLNKSKSTVHHHIQKLIEIGLIEVIREEKVRGSIPAKIYALRNAHVHDNVFVCGIGNRPCPSLITGKISGTINEILTQGIDKNLSEKIIQDEKVIEIYNRNIHQSRFRFYQKLSTLEEAPKTLRRIFQNEESFNSIIFLSEPQYQKMREIYNEFLVKLYELIETSKKKTTKSQKPFIFLASAMNLKDILEKNIPL